MCVCVCAFHLVVVGCLRLCLLSRWVGLCVVQRTADGAADLAVLLLLFRVQQRRWILCLYCEYHDTHRILHTFLFTFLLSLLPCSRSVFSLFCCSVNFISRYTPQPYSVVFGPRSLSLPIPSILMLMLILPLPLPPLLLTRSARTHPSNHPHVLSTTARTHPPDHPMVPPGPADAFLS